MRSGANGREDRIIWVASRGKEGIEDKRIRK